MRKHTLNHEFKVQVITIDWGLRPTQESRWQKLDELLQWFYLEAKANYWNVDAEKRPLRDDSTMTINNSWVLEVNFIFLSKQILVWVMHVCTLTRAHAGTPSLPGSGL